MYLYPDTLKFIIINFRNAFLLQYYNLIVFKDNN